MNHGGPITFSIDPATLSAIIVGITLLLRRMNGGMNGYQLLGDIWQSMQKLSERIDRLSSLIESQLQRSDDRHRNR